MNEPHRPRHRPELGYARGDETRRRIIQAAIQLFGQRGYDGASTRDIARLAGVNAPALQYYFNGKEGLYTACAEDIAQAAATHFQPALAFASEVLDAAQADREQLITAFHGIQDALADHLLGSQDAQSRRLFVTHEQAGQGPNLLMDIMGRLVRPHINKISAALIARLTGLAPTDALTQIRAMTLLSQVMIFYMAPRKMQESLGPDVDGQRLEMLKEIVRSQARVLIESWQGDRRPGRSAD